MASLANQCLSDEDVGLLESGRLDPPAVERARRHLAGCPACRDSYRVRAGADPLLTLELPPDSAPGQLTPDGEHRTDPGRSLADTRSAEPGPGRGTASHARQLGPYLIERELGRGGMGVVLAGHDPVLDRKAAIKVINSAEQSAEDRVRFLREARAIAALDHDHIVPIWLVGEAEGELYIVMPLLRGESLEQRVERSPRPGLAEALRWVREAASGLARAHELGIIHRDVKPGNLWLEDRGEDGTRVRLLDFGLARDQKRPGEPSISVVGQVVGTPHYMAPEQARGEALDPRADLFSLGCVLYQLLTGKLPFAGKYFTDVLVALQRDTPPAPNALAPSVPVAVSDLTMALLARDPAARPASARELVRQLKALEPSVAPRPVPSSPPPRRPRRPLLLAAGALLPLLAFALLWILIPTRKGTLRVRCDPAAQIRVVVTRGGATIIDDVTKRSFELTAGDYGVEVRELPEGKVLKAESFRLTRGGERVVEVTAQELVDAEKKGTGRVDGGPPAVPIPRDPPPRDPLFGKAQAGRTVTYGFGPLRQSPFAERPASVVAVLGDENLRHGSSVRAIAYSPDGKRVATSCKGQEVRIWDAERLTPLSRIPLPTSAAALAWRPDGAALAIGTADGIIYQYDLSGAKPRALASLLPAALPGGPLGQVRAVAYAAADRLIAGYDSDNLGAHLVDWSLGPVPAAEQMRPQPASPVQGLCAFAGGTRLISATQDGSLLLWDLARKPKQLASQQFIGKLTALAVSRDGGLVAVAGEKCRVSLLDVCARSLAHRVRTAPNVLAHDGASILGLSFSPDGRHLAYGGQSLPAGVLDLQRPQDWPRPPADGGGELEVQAIAFSPDGRSVLSGLDSALAAWKFEGGRLSPRGAPRTGHVGAVMNLDFSPDGRYLATGGVDRTARFWDLAVDPPRQLKVTPRHANAVQVALGPDGVTLAVGVTACGQVHFHDCARGEGDLPEPAGVVTDLGPYQEGIALSPDGQWLFTGHDQHVGFMATRLADRPCRPRAMVGASRRVLCLSTIPGGRFLAAVAKDAEVRIHDLEDPDVREIATLRLPVGGSLSASVSREGRVATASAYDRFGVYEIREKQVKALLTPPHDKENALQIAVSPDGRLVAVGSHKGSLLVLDVDTGKEFFKENLPGGIHMLKFAPDGRHVATANLNGTVYLIKVAK